MASALFLFKANGVNRHAWIHRFEHVVKRDQPDRYSGERLHFHTGLTSGRASNGDH